MSSRLGVRLKLLVTHLLFWNALFCALGALLGIYLEGIDGVAIFFGCMFMTALIVISGLIFRGAFEADTTTGGAAIVLVLKPLIVFLFLGLCAQKGNWFLLNIVIGVLSFIPATLTFALQNSRAISSKNIRRRRSR